MALEQYGNNLSTALTAGISDVQTLIEVDDINGWPTEGDFHILMEDEIAVVTAVSTVAGDFFFTVSRGVENTAPTAHALGVSVRLILTAESMLRNPRSMTTEGDIEYLDACGDPVSLAAPSNGIYGIRWTNHVPAWSSVGATTGGDIPYYSGTTGLAPFHAPSTDGLYAVAWTNSVPTWVTISLQVIPAGVIQAYGGNSAPTGYLLCDGSTVSRTTYSSLFSVISTNYGTGNGTTTFNLPDLRQRYPIGRAASGYAATLGVSFGTFDHTHTANHAHTLGGHTHTFTTSTDGDHSHGIGQDNDFDRTGGSIGDTGSPSDVDGNHSHTGTTAIASPDSTGQAVLTTGTNNPPSLVVHYIIKT